LLQSLADIIAPVTPERFFAEYHGRRVLHVPGRAEKFASLMSWPDLNRLLELDVWSATSLKLVLDRRTLPAESYCRPALDRNKNHVMRPSAERVLEWGRKGASLVLHEIESLGQELRQTHAALEQDLGARGMVNLYCSWKGRQAFDSHFDKHDVFAFHIAGEKRWRIYENRAEAPIEHTAWQNIPQAFFDENKGRVKEEIVLKPGDLLYLPRGTYHDAIAVSEACIHLSVGMTVAVGLSWLTQLWELALEDPLFRADLPPKTDQAVFDAHLATLADRFAALARSEEGRARARRLREAGPPPPRFDLPAGAAAPLFRVRAGNLKLVRRGADWMVKDGASTRAVSEAEAQKLSWILSRRQFSRAEFDAAFAGQSAEERERLLAGLARQGCLAAA
jgi:ribosomal protein L16 Arg81 hydroxylase